MSPPTREGGSDRPERPLSRRCRAGRGPATRSGPLRQLGAAGPSTWTRLTVPSASSSFRRRTSVGASSRIWVAQAVESHDHDEHAVVEGLGPDVGGGVLADDVGPAADRAADGDRLLPAALGDHPVDDRADQLRVAVVRTASPTGWCARRSRTWVRPGAAGVDAACARLGAGGGERGAGEVGSGPSPDGGCGGSAASVMTPAAARRRRRPRRARRDSAAGTSRGDRGGDEDLLGAGDELGQPLAPRRVELGEHVVEHQHRLGAGAVVRTQQVVRREPQRERERPRLAVARVTLRRQLAERRGRVRRGADRRARCRGRAPACARRRAPRASPRLESPRGRVVASRRAPRRATTCTRCRASPPARRDRPRTPSPTQRREVVDESESRGDEFGAGGDEVLVPHLERRQVVLAAGARRTTRGRRST